MGNRLNQWKQKIIAFMYGRYGVDTLYYALNVFWLVCLFLGVLTGMVLFHLLAWLALGYMTFRMFSRNYAKRRRENELFLRCWNPVKGFFKLQWTRIRDCRTSVYRKCPACRSVLRLPHRRGKHTAVCPRCANRFDVHIIL